MKSRKIFIVALSIALIVCMSFSTNVNSLSSSKTTATIDAQLQSILQDATSTEKIPVDIWLYETSTQEEREQAIYSKIGLNKATITAAKSSVSDEKVDEYIATERSLYAAERAAQYAALKREYASIEGLQETRKTNTRLFYSQYAPMISAELTRAEIKTLASDSRVQSIEYSPDVKLENQSDISVPTIGADFTRDTLGYTGSGIKIGLLEAIGLPDKEKPYFNENKISYDPNVDQRELNDHAEQVAAIIVAQPKTISGVTYEGIVPDAQLYATYAGTLSAMRSRVEWLLSQDVHVINMSAGSESSDPYTYGTYEKWIDHLAFNHHVHFVQSSGNDNGYVVRPAMAYNIITVGAINDRNTPDCDNDDQRYYFGLTNGSSYEEDDSLTNKPDLVAPGVYIDSAAYLEGNDYENYGTSLSAPHVTAVVAQLCQRKPELKLLQDAMKAILTASVSHNKIRYNTMGDTNLNQVNDNYDKCGAGVVNARSALATVIDSRYESGSFAANTEDGAQVMYTFNVTNINNPIRISLSWLKCSVFAEGESHTTGNLTTGTLANLNLYVYDSAEEVAHSKKIGINTEIVEFQPTRTGTHRIYVKHTTHSNKRVYYGLAWWHPES